MQIIPVILSGGSGARLWPLSRKECPKQYLSLVGDNTTLQETILRLNALHINVGTVKDITIRETAETMKEVVDCKGKLTFHTTKPDCAPRKLIDVAMLNSMGWRYKIDLKTGLKKTYIWFI